MSNQFEGAVELPAGEAKVPGVVVLHEYWGVNDQLKVVLKRWAEEGFVAAAPDLYHGTVVPIGQHDVAGGLLKQVMSNIPAALKQIADTVEMLKAHPRCNGKVAVTGYCMGGALTLASAVNIRGLSAVVPFYGLPGDLDWSKVDAPIQAHFAKTDDWATVEGAEKVKAAVRVPMELHVYDAQHAFCNDQRPDVYNADACRQAWGRTVAFVRAHTT